MNKKTKSTTAKDNATGSNSPVTKEVPSVAVESLVFSPKNATERPVSPARSTCHKKKETVKDCKAMKDAEATSKSS